MRALLQRVSKASVSVNGDTVSSINGGLLIFLGVESADSVEDCDWLSTKVANLRIFDDVEGVMNKSLIDISGDAIVVSQFTLHALTKKGNRPSYIKAARPEQAEPLYLTFVKLLQEKISGKVGLGQFGAHMLVNLVNDGPVTIWIDTKNKE